MDADEDREIQAQVRALRASLEKAKTTIMQQKQTLEQFTSPPFVHAIVISVSNQPKLGSGKRFTDVNLSEVIADPRIITFGEYRIGDRLLRKNITNVQIAALNEAKHFEVAGFTEDQDAIIQLDGDKVILASVSDIAEFFILLKKKDDGTVKEATAIILVDERFMEVSLPTGAVISSGDCVCLITQTMQIVKVTAAQPNGIICHVRRVIDETFVEVDIDSSVKAVFSGKYSATLEKGDRVVVDNTQTIVLRNLGKEDSRFNFTNETKVTWDDIGGLEEAKREMIEAVELPHTHPDLFKFYGKKPVKGILLAGPAGCGKTLIGKATATALARIYNNDTNSSGFMYVKGPEVLDRFVGVAEAAIRQIFATAREHKLKFGYPAVIFIDEADAIMAKRGSGISSDIERTIVPMFLTEMDGLEESGALVILATNRPDILDPAVTRDNRVDRKILVNRPNAENTAKIITLHLKKVPLYNGSTCEELAEFVSGELFSPRRVLYEITTKRGVCNLNLSHIINGAMAVSCVERATSIALQHSLQGGTEPRGISKEDLVEAVNRIEKENRILDHEDEIRELVGFSDGPVKIIKLRQSN